MKRQKRSERFLVKTTFLWQSARQLPIDTDTHCPLLSFSAKTSILCAPPNGTTTTTTLVESWVLALTSAVSGHCRTYLNIALSTHNTIAVIAVAAFWQQTMDNIGWPKVHLMLITFSSSSVGNCHDEGVAQRWCRFWSMLRWLSLGSGRYYHLHISISLSVYLLEKTITRWKR